MNCSPHYRRSVPITTSLILLAAGLMGTVCLQPLEAQDGSAGAAVAAPSADNAAPVAPVEPAKPGVVQDKRAFGVLPNYRTAQDSATYTPITPKMKMRIAAKDAFDYPGLILAAGFAGLYQLQDSDPSYGQGVEGYAKYAGAAFADQIISTLLSEGVLPSVLHQDPRYFRRGPDGGTNGQRARYALTRIFVTRTDSGKSQFNYSEVLGSAGAVAISNLYYPDTRAAHLNIEKLVIQLSTDALGNVLKEFWPDVKQRYLSKHSKAAAPVTP